MRFAGLNTFRAIVMSIAALLCGGALSRAAANPETARTPDAVLGDRIAKAVLSDGRLWLLGRGPNALGGLVSFQPDGKDRQVQFESDVLDVERVGCSLWALRLPSGKTRTAVLSRWHDGKFIDRGEFRWDEGDGPVAILSKAGDPAVLGAHSLRVLTQPGDAWVERRIQSTNEWGVQVPVAISGNGNDVYVGLNKGEWGGGLIRVDLSTGHATKVERRDSKDLCAGPLNADCDPVTGIIPDAQKPECVLVSIGLAHMMDTGRVLRVCGSTVETVFEKAIEGAVGHQTEPVFGVAPAPHGGLWAVTNRGVYQINGETIVAHKMPAFPKGSGLILSRDVPGVLLLLTDVNWAVSVSGYTPLIVPLDESECPN